MEKLHHRIRLRILPCSTVSENRRELEVPGAEVPVVARWMASSRHATNRRRRTRKGPEPACVRALFGLRGGTRREVKDELTSCRGTVYSAWQKPPVRRKGGRAGLPARVSGRHVVRGRQSSPQARLVKSVNNQVRWAAAQLWTRPSAPECGDTLKALVGDQRPI